MPNDIDRCDEFDEMNDIWITEVAARYAITVLANAVGCLSGNDLD